MKSRGREEPTYSLGAVARLTGVSPATLRAWERRYEAVVPLRTEGGTRRYRERDVSRLRLLKAAVEAGHRIGDVVGLDMEELRRRGEPIDGPPRAPVADILAAFTQLDPVSAEELLAFQLSALGPVRFVHEIAHPLLDEVGRGWAAQTVSVAAEHMASSLLRSFLGAALRPARSADALRVVFATPEGERHELGLLAAALGATSLGVDPVYLGADLPADELVRAVEVTGAPVLALSCVDGDLDASRAILAELRERIPASVEIWVGGAGTARMTLPEGVLRVTTLPEVEERVGLLRARAD